MVDLRANIEIFVTLAVLGIALLQSAVAWLGYMRLQSRKLALISLGFAFFAAKGAYLVWWSWQTRGAEEWLLPVAIADLIGLLLLYFAIRIP